jgi:hypothetical protein
MFVGVLESFIGGLIVLPISLIFMGSRISIQMTPHAIPLLVLALVLTALDSAALGLLVGTIVNLGAPLNYHLILGAGVTTAVYIGFRGIGKYFGARFGATVTHMPPTVQKDLGLTLLPHSGVSLIFTGIICTTLAARPDLVHIVQGTIAAAAIINEFIAVILAKKGFELAGEIPKDTAA